MLFALIVAALALVARHPLICWQARIDSICCLALDGRLSGRPNRRAVCPARYPRFATVAYLDDDFCRPSADGPQAQMRFEAIAAPSASEPSLAQATSGATNS